MSLCWIQLHNWIHIWYPIYEIGSLYKKKIQKIKQTFHILGNAVLIKLWYVLLKSWLHLFLLQVFSDFMILLYIPIVYIGCTSPGSYGNDCSTPCPQNCQDKRCHIVEGTCLECVDIYNGSICSKGYCQD